MSAPLLLVCEDPAAASFHPLGDTRPVFDLRAGIFSVRERLARLFPERQVCALVRESVAPCFQAATGLPVGWARVPLSSDALLVNGRLLGGEEWAAGVRALRAGQAACSEEQVGAARLDGALLERCRATGETWPAGVLAGLPRADVPGDWVRYPWDLVAQNLGWLARDARSFELGRQLGTVEPGAHLKEAGQVFVGAGARVEPCCFLDASSGPIVLDRDVLVASHTRVEGPAYVGPGSQLLGGRIGEGTSLGPQCRVAGEIEATVVQGYSNKRHHGFVGHSYLGEWVNLGALTTTSDLKNNYGPVRMWHAGQVRDTGLLKLGSLVGDHSKTAIGTLLGTGTVVGVMTNVFRRDPPGRVGSFRWLGPEEDTAHRWEKARVLLTTVLARRGVSATPEYTALLERLAAEAGAI